jgi:hypothetical protein
LVQYLSTCVLVVKILAAFPYLRGLKVHKKVTVCLYFLQGSAVFAEIAGPPTQIPNLQDLNFNNLPGNFSLPGNLPVNISNVPTVEEGQRVFEEKCKKMGHPEAYQAAEVCMYYKSG